MFYTVSVCMRVCLLTEILCRYDSEREASMRRELMLLLTTLMDIVCGRSPSAWLSIFKRIIGSNQRSAAAASEVRACADVVVFFFAF